ncbi:MAG: hypothetical protein JHC33_03405 [Ignisphaera sp.]|nr:hypothetical protein [Ignisphaera sp.]
MKGTLEKQIEIEEAIKQEAIQKYLNNLHKAIENDRFNGTREGTFLVKTTLPTYAAALQAFLEKPDRGTLEKDKNLLKLLVDDYEVIALLVISTVVSSTSHSIKSASTIVGIATAIVRELAKVSLSDNIRRDNPRFISYLGTEFKRANKRRKEMLIAKHIKDLENFDTYNDNKRVSVRIGVMLIDILISSGANLVEKHTVFVNGNKSFNLRLTEAAQDAIFEVGKDSLASVMTTATRLPTIIKPVDYDPYTLKGGYHKYPISLLKTQHSKHRKFLKGKDFSKVIPIVNKLQSTPWRFNKRIVDVITDIFEDNMVDPRIPGRLPKLFGGLPTSNTLKLKELITQADFGELEDGWKLGKEGHHAYVKAKNELMILLDKESGNRLSVIFALATYTKMCDYDELYFPHQLDYRGRVYPHTAFVSVQQPAYIKAMLEFANGDTLTEVGLEGLKIHLANCYGKDKVLFKERIAFIDSILPMVLRSAEDPMGNIYEWTEADSPFEFLAGCFAYKDYLDGKPIHLPTQWDSTCSGIQVYSGLLYDKEGAEAVNVIGQERNDIYQRVADRDNIHLANGNYPKVFSFTDSEKTQREAPSHVEAKSLIGNITRSLVKRNVMTVPYSVSFRGMQDQLKGELQDLKFAGKQFWEGELWVTVRLLATLNQTSINEIVKGAQLGQEYLKAITRTLTEAAVWYTPIYNLPILQPSFKVDTYTVQTLMGTLNVQYSTDELDKRSQVNAIAPNIIHSLDSTILYGTVDRYEKDIGTIHDCFMVHPNDWIRIKNCFKESYVDLMSMNPLRHIGGQLDPEGLVDVPYIGTLDLNDVMLSEYIIS